MNFLKSEDKTSSIQVELISIFERIISIHPQINQPILDHGVDSVLIVELIDEIEARFSIDLDIQDTTSLKDIEEPGDTVTYEELAIRFIVDENMKNWLSIYDWITALGFPTPELQKKRQILKENMELRTDAVLTVLTSNMNAQLNFKFLECFPLNLSSISFDAAGTDVEYVVADVSFRYDMYEVQNLLNNEESYLGAPINRNA